MTGWLLARRQLDRNLVGRRSNSSLPALAALMMPWNLQYRRRAANLVRRTNCPEAQSDAARRARSGGRARSAREDGQGEISRLGDIASTAGALRNRKLDDEVKATGRPSTIPPESEAEAAFLAGAALARLDAVVRENPPWAGVFRRRLALSAAAASVARAGRTEDEARLRDTVHLARPGADPGPAGKHLLVWRELSAHSAGQWRSSFHAAAAVLGVANDGALRGAVEAAEACAGGNRAAPFAAAQVFTLVRRALTANAARHSLGRGGEGELLAAGLADAVLAQRLKWPLRGDGSHRRLEGLCRTGGGRLPASGHRSSAAAPTRRTKSCRASTSSPRCSSDG